MKRWMLLALLAAVTIGMSGCASWRSFEERLCGRPRQTEAVYVPMTPPATGSACATGLPAPCGPVGMP